MLFVIKTWIHPAMRHQGPTVKSASINKEKRKHPIIWAFVLLCRGKTGLRAVTGAPGGGLAACRFTPTAQRPSSTPCSPARFHPSGFLSGAGGAYSPRQGCSLFAKGAHDPLVPIIIRKNGGFVNSPGKVFCKTAFDSVCVYKRDGY